MTTLLVVIILVCEIKHLYSNFVLSASSATHTVERLLEEPDHIRVLLINLTPTTKRCGAVVAASSAVAVDKIGVHRRTMDSGFTFKNVVCIP